MTKGERTRSAITHPKKRAFLAAYAKCGNVTAAAELSGVARKMHYDWVKTDPIYAEWFEDAHEESIQRLESEARRRAVEGVMEPVFYQGEIVGYVNKFSDNLLMFTLKAARPETYRDRVDANIRVVTVDALDAEIARLESELAESGAAPQADRRAPSSS